MCQLYEGFYFFKRHICSISLIVCQYEKKFLVSNKIAWLVEFNHCQQRSYSVNKTIKKLTINCQASLFRNNYVFWIEVCSQMPVCRQKAVLNVVLTDITISQYYKANRPEMFVSATHTNKEWKKAKQNVRQLLNLKLHIEYVFVFVLAPSEHIEI